MSKSGVQVNEECLTTFQQLKQGKLHKYIIFAINSDNTHIIVEKTSSSLDYQQFIMDLPENDCRYAVYDLEYHLEGEGKRTKMCFFVWSPETSPIRSKMLYASSKDALRRALCGISVEIQGTDLSEISFGSVFERVTRRTSA
ncbi:hypothetical protein PCANB_001258 [Pneumocystis canis]|nr:hypothetical protein PCK1_001283 [Pneumocystis canis]KAG5436983.1 hypothetical protein PCANB_001258 [Pneumocystis canis]